MVSVGELFRLPTMDRLAGDRAPSTWAASNPASRAAALDARDFVTVGCNRKSDKRITAGHRWVRQEEQEHFVFR